MFLFFTQSFAGSVVEVTDWLRSCVDAQEAGVDGSKSRKGPSSDSGSGSGRAAEITHAASNVLFEQSLIIVGNASAVIAQQEADQQQYLCGELVMLLKSNRNPGLCAAVAEVGGVMGSIHYSCVRRHNLPLCQLRCRRISSH